MDASITKLTNKPSVPHVSHEQPSLKEVMPVLGHLKIKFGYPHLPQFVPNLCRGQDNG
jgi:hypothetical protein